MSAPWIGVDLDGTLAHYDGWQNILHIGAPVPAMVGRVKRWLADGYKVRVLTARMSQKAEAWKVQKEIWRWTLEHVGAPLPATCVKGFDMIELWDDRAVAVEANTGRQLSPSTRGLDLE